MSRALEVIFSFFLDMILVLISNFAFGIACFSGVDFIWDAFYKFWAFPTCIYIFFCTSNCFLRFLSLFFFSHFWALGGVDFIPYLPASLLISHTHLYKIGELCRKFIYFR